MTRRALLAGGASLALAGCAGAPRRGPSASAASRIDPYYVSMYSAQNDGGIIVPAVPLNRIDPVYYRQVVSYPAPEQAGTVVVDPRNTFLYHVRGDGTAVRYGIGVGREGFSWSGNATVRDKQEWPKWHPPASMIERQPELSKYANGGMDGGLANPLGARALYLYEGNRDTLYRIHGTNEPWSIGQAVSSGCIRMLNQDAIDLYNRVPLGTPVIVRA
ncbi:L,D-transpeptidase [Breoghania sp. L-A4]|uniref:L,D-transpeptidase n=1 Tax=Breoghania sp. L-A4 TaxID=2304600 RepID=UPI000E35E048|nr:L,D-transpeptidase [Breoghania sp. L-A4]AXS42494.1 L,D-transpeptidase [Breoghania sp. L-A4]